MANKIMKFVSETLGNVRGMYIDGQPWLFAKDVCKILELGNVSQAVMRLDDDEKQLWESTPSKIYNNDSRRGRKYLLVNEFGLYALVLTSRTPKAHEFKRWVTHEVLPSIRRYGEYRLAWNEARTGGKVTRLTFTDAIKKFCEYLKERGELDRPEKTWYIIFTNLVNKIAGVDDERDNLTAKKLFEIDTCENIAAKTIESGMSAGKGHHDINEDCKAKLSAWKELTE